MQIVKRLTSMILTIILALSLPFSISSSANEADTSALSGLLAAGSEASSPVTAAQPKEGENPGDAVLSSTDSAAVNFSGSGQETDGAVETDTDGGPQVAAPSALLMEATTGQVIFEKNADEQRSPASITKIMTLILIFDALADGSMKLTDEVVTSSYAKSMGGSQVFLEEGEVQTVETLIKCIVIASGNDASVAMAEYVAGSEEAFVKMMNDRAAGLGMTNTHFEDCCGLTESPTHLTTARDIAVMSRELITKYPQIHNYSTIWMENITHVTNQGSKEFGLSNTNKLLKMATNFEVTGLKTGSTSLAKYCLSATGRKDGVNLIASIMAAPDFKTRFADAISMLNYGFANCKLYTDTNMPLPEPVSLVNGVQDTITGRYDGTFSYLSTTGEDFNAIEKEIEYFEPLTAPMEEGTIIGRLHYRLNGKELGVLDIVAAETIREARFTDYLKKTFRLWLLGRRSTALKESTEPEETNSPEETTEPQTTPTTA